MRKTFRFNKDVIKKGLKKETFNEMKTLIVEIEDTMNDCQLTVVSGELDDETALTPSYLLLGYNLSTFSSFIKKNDASLKERGLNSTSTIIGRN